MKTVKPHIHRVEIDGAVQPVAFSTSLPLLSIFCFYYLKKNSNLPAPLRSFLKIKNQTLIKDGDNNANKVTNGCVRHKNIVHKTEFV